MGKLKKLLCVHAKGRAAIPPFFDQVVRSSTLDKEVDVAWVTGKEKEFARQKLEQMAEAAKAASERRAEVPAPVAPDLSGILGHAFVNSTAGYSLMLAADGWRIALDDPPDLGLLHEPTESEIVIRVHEAPHDSAADYGANLEFAGAFVGQWLGEGTRDPDFWEWQTGTATVAGVPAFLGVSKGLRTTSVMCAFPTPYPKGGIIAVKVVTGSQGNYDEILNQILRTFSFDKEVMGQRLKRSLTQKAREPEPDSDDRRRLLYCRNCHTMVRPDFKKETSKDGWALFWVLLFCCLPLCWIPLRMKKEHKLCSQCGYRLE